jgi:hypothetical protein
VWVPEVDGPLRSSARTVHLVVRRFICGNTDCDTVTFTEQVPGLTLPYRRRTVALLGVLEHIAVALAGRAGARLAGLLGIVVHPSTLTRLIRALPEPQRTHGPEIVGVDDFALRRSHRYGTIIVDMATGKAIDVLETRDAEPLTRWLTEHPAAQVICPDRAGAYALAARDGAPDAIQCADRWHLWHNLAEHVQRAVTRHHGCIKKAVSSTASGTPVEPFPTRAATVTRARERRPVHSHRGICPGGADPGTVRGHPGVAGRRAWPAGDRPAGPEPRKNLLADHGDHC